MKRLALILLLTGCLDGDPLFDHQHQITFAGQKVDRGMCFTQSERLKGWVQQEVGCNYLPDSTTHEIKTYRFTTSDTVNPFEYHWPRRR